MFVADELMLELSVGAARARLVNLARGGGLSAASEAADQDGLAAVIRVGPFGDVPGASKVVRARFLGPVYGDDAMRLALRWEATGVTSGLFPVLDADISLTPAGEQTTGWRWPAPTGRRSAASEPGSTRRSPGARFGGLPFCGQQLPGEVARVRHKV
jgi:hypothetical protein